MFFGLILTAFNVFAGVVLADMCHNYVLYLDFSSGLLSYSYLLQGAVWAILINLTVLIPIFSFRISWQAVNDHNPIAWCRKNGCRFLAPLAIPLITVVFVAFYVMCLTLLAYL